MGNKFDLAIEVKGKEKKVVPVPRLRQCDIVAVNKGSVDIKLGGSDTVISGVKYLANASVIVGRSAFVLASGGDFLVLGVLA